MLLVVPLPRLLVARDAHADDHVGVLPSLALLLQLDQLSGGSRCGDVKNSIIKY